MNFQVDLQGKTALVTGASSGIGREIALALAKSGAVVGVHYFRTADGADETAALITAAGGSAFTTRADVSAAGEVNAMIADVGTRFGGRLDLLVNNAGDLIERKTLAQMSEALWDSVIDVNLKSVFLVTQAALPLLQAARGRVINLSSVAGQNGGGLGAGAYAASKAGVIALTKAMAKEFAPSGILVNGIAPGLIATRYHDRYSSAELRKAMLAQIPLGREGTVEDVAGSVLFLASDAASYITGQTINVNGGNLLI